MRPSLRGLRGVLATEWLIVILAMASAVLSAVSFSESTRFGDASSDLANQARFAESQDSQWRSGIQAKVAHDRRIALRCETAVQRRNAALLRYSQSFDPSAVAALVEAEQDRIALEAQFVGDFSCSAYDVGRVFEWEALQRLDRFVVDSGAALEARSESYGRAEQWAVLAAVVFALSLLLLTAADSTSRAAWIRGWLLASVGGLGLGACLVALSIVESGDDPIPGLLPMIGLVVALILLAVGIRGAEGRGWTSRIATGRTVRWWAELLGAVALVMLTVSALGLALSSSRERAAVADADELTLESRRALEIGQQSALALLGVIEQLSQIDASQAGSLQSPSDDGSGGSDGPAAQPERDALIGEIWGREEAAWEQLLAVQAAGGRPAVPPATSTLGCLDRDLVLAWAAVDLEGGGGDGTGTPPSALLAWYRDDPDAYRTLIERAATGAVVCSSRAAVLMQRSQAWGDRASAFTLAVIILGLAGFLFALAADPDRSRMPRRWLLACAALGLAAGTLQTAAAWASGPRDLSDEAIGRGTVAYARGQMAQVAGECEDARRLADEAGQDLGGFAPAHVARAYALLCSDGDDGLIDPQLPGATLDAYRSRLEDAIGELGFDDSTARGNLGWSYLLLGLDGGLADDARADAIARGRELNREALLADPGNPFWCFNRALGALAAGEEDAARGAYAEALASLGGKTGETGDCQAVAFDDPVLRQWIRLMALADLELLPDAEEHDAIRELLVAGSVAAEPRPAAVEGLSLELFPQQVWLAADGTSLADRPFSVVWYHRPDAGRRWAVMVDPSLQTLEPGVHGSLVPAHRLLPAGEYRADVYVDGALAGRVATASDFWASRGLDPASFHRVEIHDLGVSAVVPTGWKVVAEQPGVEVVLEGAHGRLALRRAEGARREQTEQVLESWSEGWLERWGSPAIGDDEGSLQPGGWYLGFLDTLTVEVRPGLLRGAGHHQYLVPDDGGALSAEAVAGATCPGTTLMSTIETDDPDVANVVWLSQDLDGALHSVTAGDIALTGSVVTPAFSIDIPAGWTAAGCPGSSVAVAPGGMANVYVGSGPISGTLSTYVDDAITSFEAGGGGFTLLSREATRLANGLPSEEIAFSWTPDATTFQRTQVYVKSGSTVFVLSFTSALADAATYADELDRELRSFIVRPPEGSRVVAACVGCSDAERRQRQAGLDELGELLASVDKTCVDTTDAAPAGTLARIGCGLPGGFEVAFARWASRAELDAFANGYLRRPGALLQDWRLYADQDSRTGLTLEWLDGDVARFFWTYDDRLVSADASLRGGDQLRLNSWWQTSGALLRE